MGVLLVSADESGEVAVWHADSAGSYKVRDTAAAEALQQFAADNQVVHKGAQQQQRTRVGKNIETAADI